MDYLIHIKVPMHIRQWAYNAYGCPVEFPASGNECAVIRRFLAKTPGAKLSDVEIEQQNSAEHHTAAVTHTAVSKIRAADEEYCRRAWEQEPDDYMAVFVPDSKAKPVRQFHYLGPRGRQAVKEVVTDLFKMNLWAELKDVADRHCRLSTLISAWCEKHGIDIDYEDTVRQVFYRMRAQHAEKGVILNSQTRIKKDLHEKSR